MHFKVELCFDSGIHPSKVLMPSLLQSRRPHWGPKAGLEDGEVGAGGGGPLGLQIRGFMGTKKKPAFGLDFLPGYHPGLKGRHFKLFCETQGRRAPWDRTVVPNGKIKK